MDELNQVKLPDFLFDYSVAKPLIDAMISGFSNDFQEAKMRRDERYVNLDVEQMRQAGDIEEDETFIPDRVIDGNIKDEKSDTLAFLNAGNRLGIFDCVSNPETDTRNLETQVTKGLTYNGWYREYDRLVDGAGLHGRDFMEVMFDITKPLHVGFEHVGFDKCYFNRKLDNLEDSERIAREYNMAVFKLEEWSSQYGFIKEQVDKVLSAFQDKKRDESITLFKIYFKYQGVVYVCWYCQDKGATDWIKPPEKLRLGIWHEETDELTKQTTLVESDIDEYPIKTYVYCEDEQQYLTEKKGRGFLDSPLQEANTAIITAYTNSLMRSAAIYASPKQSDNETSEMKQLDLRLEPNAIYNNGLDFWSKPAPDYMQLQAIQFLDTRSAVHRGKTAYAVNNRKDSRKTAKELEVASNDESKITAATNLATFSEFLRSILEFSWKIIQSQAISDKIQLLLIKQQSNDPMIQEEEWVNDKNVLSQSFDIRPAGDTDIIEAQQEQQKMMQDWPVIQTTPLAQKFLSDFIKLRYPKKADEYIAALMAANPKQLVTSLSTALKGALGPEDLKVMTPQDKQNLAQLQDSVNNYLTAA